MAKPSGMAAKLGKTSKLFLTTTHFHPELVTGQSGFPPDTTVIRPTIQASEGSTSSAPA